MKTVPFVAAFLCMVVAGGAMADDKPYMPIISTPAAAILLHFEPALLTDDLALTLTRRQVEKDLERKRQIDAIEAAIRKGDRPRYDLRRRKEIERLRREMYFRPEQLASDDADALAGSLKDELRQHMLQLAEQAPTKFVIQWRLDGLRLDRDTNLVYWRVHPLSGQKMLASVGLAPKPGFPHYTHPAIFDQALGHTLPPGYGKGPWISKSRNWPREANPNKVMRVSLVGLDRGGELPLLPMTPDLEEQLYPRLTPEERRKLLDSSNILAGDFPSVRVEGEFTGFVPSPSEQGARVLVGELHRVQLIGRGGKALKTYALDQFPTAETVSSALEAEERTKEAEKKRKDLHREEQKAKAKLKASQDKQDKQAAWRERTRTKVEEGCIKLNKPKDQAYCRVNARCNHSRAAFTEAECEEARAAFEPFKSKRTR